jgi:hypothetical protein
MLTTRQLCIIACRGHRGFALVVTLSLMVLLTIIAVGLLSLSAISLRGRSQNEAMSTARANARMALMLALGELQKELGPDQRISAPGGQQLEEGIKSASGQWTGVYNAWPAVDEKRPTPVFRRWLISGDESVVTDSASPKNPNPFSNKIAMVAKDPDCDVLEAGLIKTSKGGCAWWVGDQNMKAKLGGAVKAAETPAMATKRLQAAHEVFFGNGTIAIDAPQLDRLASTRTAELLG